MKLISLLEKFVAGLRGPHADMEISDSQPFPIHLAGDVVMIGESTAAPTLIVCPRGAQLTGSEAANIGVPNAPVLLPDVILTDEDVRTLTGFDASMAEAAAGHVEPMFPDASGTTYPVPEPPEPVIPEGTPAENPMEGAPTADSAPTVDAPAAPAESPAVDASADSSVSDSGGSDSGAGAGGGSGGGDGGGE